jgi:hypothetical protein
MKYVLSVILALFVLSLFKVECYAQDGKKSYNMVAVGFYNFENLFDTVNTPRVLDHDFTPEGSNNWTGERYLEKLEHLSGVIAEVGIDLNPDGLAVLGVSEIENRDVLEDFVKQKAIRKRNYQIIHYDSPDRRGVDVALMYNPTYFEYESSQSLPVNLVDKGDTLFTRDILYVSGKMNGEPMHFMVGHWPSRSGGEKRSQGKRNAAADVCRVMYDSLLSTDPNVKVVLMGDLNDDPVSPSLVEHIRAEGKLKKLDPDEMYNPMLRPFQKGAGTTAWRDAWSLFDQVVVSYGFVNKDAGGYQFYKSNIHNPKHLCQKTGRYKGYPYRTYSGGQYIGGYSDHFPVFVYLVREAK